MKKHWRWILLLLPVLFLGVFLRWKTGQPEYVLRQFSGKHQGRLGDGDSAQGHLQALQHWQRFKTLPESALRIGFNVKKERTEKRLLWVSWYHPDGRLRECDLDDKGGLLHFGNGWSEETHYLSSYERKTVSLLLKRLPHGVAPAPVKEYAVFVSYFDGKEWKARVYNRRYLPKPLHQLLPLLKAREIEI